MTLPEDSKIFLSQMFRQQHSNNMKYENGLSGTSLCDDLEAGLGPYQPLRGRREHGGGRLRPRGQRHCQNLTTLVNNGKISQSGHKKSDSHLDFT